MREKHDQTTCPACSSWRVLCVLGTDLDLCLECHRCWERVDPAEHFMVDGELLSFERPCSNCAFRGNSEERQNRARWAELQQSLGLGHAFYCHKGVPMKATVEEISAGSPDSRLAFDFPEELRSAKIEGKVIPYVAYVPEHMRMCRGYLNKFITPLLKDPPRVIRIDVP
jgi:hypothetical protein